MTASITFDAVSSDIVVEGRARAHLRDVTVAFPKERIGLLAGDRVDATALMNLLCRRTMPASGRLGLAGSVSWPIGRQSSFVGSAKGSDVISHISALYGADRDLAFAFMADEFAYADLLHTRMDRWSVDARTKFALLTALIPQFDIYLIDGNIVLQSDPKFTRRYLELLSQRIGDRTLIISTRQTEVIKALCTKFALIEAQNIEIIDDVQEALARIREQKDDSDNRPLQNNDEQALEDLVF